MAIFNAQTVGGASANWNVATFTATSGTAASSIAFTVTGKPKQWALACTHSTGYITTDTYQSNYFITGAYNDGSNLMCGELRGGTSVYMMNNTSSPTGSYSNGTFTVTAGSGRYFPMGRSTYRMTWTLFYTT